jgi:hypothetical protein
MAGCTLDWIAEVAADIDQITVAVDVATGTGAVDIALVPLPRSELATFVAAQRPTAYWLIGRLPASDAPLMVAGTLASGPYPSRYLALLAAGYGMILDPTAVVSALDLSNRNSWATSSTSTGALAFGPRSR